MVSVLKSHLKTIPLYGCLFGFLFYTEKKLWLRNRSLLVFFYFCVLFLIYRVVLTDDETLTAETLRAKIRRNQPLLKRWST